MTTLTVTIARGLPGSGKSKLALALSSTTRATLIEPDNFYIRDGGYFFTHDVEPFAHQWARALTANSLFKGNSVIVADVFPTLADLAPYQELARHFGADFQVVEVDGPWTDRHGVVPQDLARMLATWEPWPRMKAPPAASAHSGDGPESRLESAARWLIDRLNDLDISQSREEIARDYYGHIEPAIARLTAALAKMEGGHD